MRIRSILFVCFVLIISTPLMAQDTGPWPGFWKGAIELPGNSLVIELSLEKDEGSPDAFWGTLNIPLQNAFALELNNLQIRSDSISFHIDAGGSNASFHGKLAGDEQIIGTFNQAGMEFGFFLEKTDEINVSKEIILENQSDLLIQTPDLQISGSITWHDADYSKPSDLVILISGSGEQDRDETITGFKPFRLLAAQLSEAGYSTFRYDDRGVGISTGDPDATLQELAADVTHIVNYFSEQSRYNVRDIYLLGHSQGAIVSYLAASETDVKGIISMAGPALRGDKIVNQQIRDISDTRNIPEPVVTENLAFQERIYEAIRNNNGWDEIEENLKARLRKQLDLLPEERREAIGNLDGFIFEQVNRQLEGAKSNWFHSFIDTDPVSELQKLDIPVLAVFGEKDMQVNAEINSTALETFSKSYTPDIEIVTIPNANHLFQDAITGFPDEYGILDKSFSREFTDTVIEWLINRD